MKPIIVLAPLAGYTNVAYRTFMKEFGCDIVVSEMISDFALFYHNKETEKMIKISPNEHPVAIQLFGGSEESLIKGLDVLNSKEDIDYIDINLGCPVNKVIKNNAGSNWLIPSRQEELFNCIKKLVSLSNKPITCKIRLGWDKSHINVVSTCKLLEKAGVKMIVIHGRTREQMYSGNSDYEMIKLAKESVSIPVIANGDINTLEKAIQVLEYTKCDGVALGRGALGNPFLISQIKRYYIDGTILPLPSINQQMDYLFEHYSRLKEEKGEYIALKEIRGIGPFYLKGFSNVKEYKISFVKVSQEEELQNIIKQIRSDSLIKRIEN